MGLGGCLGKGRLSFDEGSVAGSPGQVRDLGSLRFCDAV